MTTVRNCNGFLSVRPVFVQILLDLLTSLLQLERRDYVPPDMVRVAAKQGLLGRIPFVLGPRTQKDFLTMIETAFDGDSLKFVFLHIAQTVKVDFLRFLCKQ